MPELVTPELTLVRVADKEELNEYATARTAAGARVDKHLKANLSQLLGFDQVGNDRSKRWEAKDGTRGTFYNLADVSWFYRADIPEAIPLFGTAAAKHRQLKLQHGITDGVDVFKKVVEGNRSSREGWFCGLPPPALATLPDGASIIGLAPAPSHGAAGIVLPDAPPVATTTPAATAAVTAPVAVVVPAAALAAVAAIPITTAVLLPNGPIGHLPRATAVPALSAGSMVSAEEALTAVMEAAKLTFQVYDGVMHEHIERHRRENESLREEIAQQHEHIECHRRENESLREQNESLRERSCTVEDESQHLRELLAESYSQIEMMKKQSVNAKNFCLVMDLRKDLQHQRLARQVNNDLLKEQLQRATERIEELLKERERERFEGRHASEIVTDMMIDEGECLREQLTTKAKARKTLAGASAVPQTELTPQHVNRLAQHIEAVLFGAGRGDLERTQLLLAAVLDRPVVQRLLGAGGPQTLRAIEVSRAMLASARETLTQLSSHGKQDEFDPHGRRNDHRGTRSAHAHLAFETLLTALIPDNATDEGMLRTIQCILGINPEQAARGVNRKRAAGGNAFAFVEALHAARKRRKTAIDEGRIVCDRFWHANCRFDTNPRKKKRIRLGRSKYKEHWRHIQYETNEVMAKLFFAGHEYSQYLEGGGQPFKEDIFYKSKCPCIEQSKFEECSCPTCTIATETVRAWDRQRAVWHREAREACSCGHCAKGGAYRSASSSFAKLRSFLHAPCGKRSFNELIISQGPKSCEKVEMYKRQCCRVALPEISGAVKAMAAADKAAEAALALRGAATVAAREPFAADLFATVAMEKAAAEAEKAVAPTAAKAEKAARDAGYNVDEIRDLGDCNRCGWVAGMCACHTALLSGTTRSPLRGRSGAHASRRMASRTSRSSARSRALARSSWSA